MEVLVRLQLFWGPILLLLWAGCSTVLTTRMIINVLMMVQTNRKRFRTGVLWHVRLFCSHKACRLEQKKPTGVKDSSQYLITNTNSLGALLTKQMKQEYTSVLT